MLSLLYVLLQYPKGCPGEYATDSVIRAIDAVVR